MTEVSDCPTILLLVVCRSHESFAIRSRDEAAYVFVTCFPDAMSIMRTVSFVLP